MIRWSWLNRQMDSSNWSFSPHSTTFILQAHCQEYLTKQIKDSWVPSWRWYFVRAIVNHFVTEFLSSDLRAFINDWCKIKIDRFCFLNLDIFSNFQDFNLRKRRSLYDLASENRDLLRMHRNKSDENSITASSLSTVISSKWRW